MSIYPNVTEKDLNNLRKLADQQKNQRDFKIKIIILKQTHDIKLAESLSPITKKISEVKKSIKKLGEVIKKSNSGIENNEEIVPVEIDSDDSEGDKTKPNTKAIPNSFIFSDLMTKTLESLMSGSKSLKKKSSPSGATILGVPI